MKILIAEDELYMQKILKLYLEKEGYITYIAGDGEAALEILDKEIIDLALLDWMMPEMDGIQVARYMRQYTPQVKIILLTARGEVEDELKGLRLADDYVKKPFEPSILLMRIKKLLGDSKVLGAGTLKLYLDSKKVFIRDKEIHLSKKEFDLLEYLLRNKGYVLSREFLLDRIWGLEYEGEDRTLDTHIRRLRSKIGEERIKTYRGQGYSLEDISE